MQMIGGYSQIFLPEEGGNYLRVETAGIRIVELVICYGIRAKTLRLYLLLGSQRPVL